MAKRATTKLERIEATEGSEFTGMTREQLLLDGTPGAQSELYRRVFNRHVKKSQQA